MWSSVESHTWPVTLCPFPDETCISLCLLKSFWTEDWNIFSLWQGACHTYSCLCCSKQDFCHMFCCKWIYKYLLEIEVGWSLNTIATFPSLHSTIFSSLLPGESQSAMTLQAPWIQQLWETNLFVVQNPDGMESCNWEHLFVRRKIKGFGFVLLMETVGFLFVRQMFFHRDTFCPIKISCLCTKAKSDW